MISTSSSNTRSSYIIYGSKRSDVSEFLYEALAKTAENHVLHMPGVHHPHKFVDDYKPFVKRVQLTPTMLSWQGCYILPACIHLWTQRQDI